MDSDVKVLIESSSRLWADGDRQAALRNALDAYSLLVARSSNSPKYKPLKDKLFRIIEQYMNRGDRDRNNNRRANQTEAVPAGAASSSNNNQGQGQADKGCPAADIIRQGIAYPNQDPNNPNRPLIRAENRSFSEYVDAFVVNIRGRDVKPLQYMINAILPLKVGPSSRNYGQKPQNVLLYGPGGTGKTSSVKSLCQDYELIMVQADGATLSGSYVGQSEKCIREVSEIAIETSQDTVWRNPNDKDSGNKPNGVVLFIDEIDSILGNNKKGGPSVIEQFKTSFQVGAGVDFNSYGCLLIGATNSPWLFDQAVFDRFPIKIYYPSPDVYGRKNFICQRMLDITARNQCYDRYPYLDYTYENMVTVFFTALDFLLQIDLTILPDVLLGKNVEGYADTVDEMKRVWLDTRESANMSDIDVEDLMDMIIDQDSGKLRTEFSEAHELMWKTVLFSQRNLGEIFSAADTYAPNTWSSYNVAYYEDKSSLATSNDFSRENNRWIYVGPSKGTSSFSSIRDSAGSGEICFPPPTFSELSFPVGEFVRASSTADNLIQYYEFSVLTNDTISSNAIIKAAAEYKVQDPKYRFKNKDLEDKSTIMSTNLRLSKPHRNEDQNQ